MKLAEKIGVKMLNGFAGCPGAGEDAKYPNWITCPWPPFFGEVVKWRGNIDWKPQSDIMNRAWTFRTLGYGHDRLWWKKFISTLKLIGYDGVLSIEYEDPLMSADEGLRKAVSFMNDVLIFEEAGEAHWM